MTKREYVAATARLLGYRIIRDTWDNCLVILAPNGSIIAAAPTEYATITLSHWQVERDLIHRYRIDINTLMGDQHGCPLD